VPEPIDPSPSIAALGQVLALDFGAAWHKWLTLWREVGVRPERLRRLIISEFQIVIDGLIASARETLDDYVANVSGRFHAEIAQTMGLLRDRQRELAGIYKGLLEDRNSRTSGRHEQDHQLRLDDCERRVADLMAKRQRMEDILKSLRGGGHLA
jgi:hypothetical protein